MRVPAPKKLPEKKVPRKNPPKKRLPKYTPVKMLGVSAIAASFISVWSALTLLKYVAQHLPLGSWFAFVLLFLCLVSAVIAVQSVVLLGWNVSFERKLAQHDAKIDQMIRSIPPIGERIKYSDIIANKQDSFVDFRDEFGGVFDGGFDGNFADRFDNGEAVETVENAPTEVFANGVLANPARDWQQTIELTFINKPYGSKEREN